MEEGGLNIIKVNVFKDNLKVTWIGKVPKEDKCRWMALLKEDVPDRTYRNTMDLEFYFLSAVLSIPFGIKFFRRLPNFKKGTSYTLFMNFVKDQSYFPTKSKLRARLSQSSLVKARH